MPVRQEHEGKFLEDNERRVSEKNGENCWHFALEHTERNGDLKNKRENPESLGYEIREAHGPHWQITLKSVGPQESIEWVRFRLLGAVAR